MSLYSFTGSYAYLPEDDKPNVTMTFQEPPRSPRDEPEVPSRSFHSNALPVWSNVP
jgi:hypothetical protein